MEALESVAVGELLSKFTAAAVVCAALGITLKRCSIGNCAARRFRVVRLCATVRQGGEVGGEHETEPTEIFKHIRGMPVYPNPKTGLLSIAVCWFWT